MIFQYKRIILIRDGVLLLNIIIIVEIKTKYLIKGIPRYIIKLINRRYLLNIWKYL
jgi:hypothetical protein